MEAMTERITAEQEARLVRARAEGTDYTWTMSPLGWVVTTAAGRSYQVSPQACTCGDFQHRCAGSLLRCKHQVSLAEKMLAEQTRQAPPVVADEEAEAARIAREDAIFARLYG